MDKLQKILKAKGKYKKKFLHGWSNNTDTFTELLMIIVHTFLPVLTCAMDPLHEQTEIKMKVKWTNFQILYQTIVTRLRVTNKQ